MALISNLIKEMRIEIFKNIVLLTFLKAVVAFFIFDIVKSFIDLSYIFSYLFAALYFIVSLFVQIRRINVKIFERHNPEIDEMLSTAADNISKNNLVVQGLFEELLERVKKVSSGTIVAPSTIFLLVISIPILAIVSFEANPVRVDAISQDKIIENLEKITFVKNLFNSRSAEEGEIIEDDLLDEDIYGDRQVAVLGDEEINIKMNLGFETDLTKPREEDEEQMMFTDYPDAENVELLYDTAVLKENIEESDLARKYNEQIRGLQ